MKDFLTEEEMKMLEGSGDTTSAPDFIPDSEIPKEVPARTPSTMENFSVGFAKGGLKTAKGLGTVGQWLLDNTAGRAVNAAMGKGFTNAPIDSSGDIYRNGTESSNRANELLTPKGAAETAGFFTERIAEFLTPAGIEKAGAQLATKTGAKLATIGFPKLATASGLAIKGAAGAIETGVKTALQRNEIDNEVKINALIAAASPTLAYGVQKVGSGILNSVIKPTIQDVKNGFKIENVKKYNVGGSLSTSLEKTSSKISENAMKLDKMLANSKATIDVDDAFAKTVKQLQGKKHLVFGKVRDLNGGLKELAQDLADMSTPSGATEAGQIYGTISDLKKVPIQIANNQIKRGAGTKGAWMYGRIDKNAEAIDQVYSVFYQELKKQIDKKAPSAASKLNAEMHELIPIQSALIRRIPVADRNNVIGLGETMSLVGAAFDPRALAVLLPTIAQKSGTFGNFLMTAADNWIGKGTGAAIKTGVSNFQE